MTHTYAIQNLYRYDNRLHIEHAVDTAQRLFKRKHEIEADTLIIHPEHTQAKVINGLLVVLDDRQGKRSFELGVRG